MAFTEAQRRAHIHELQTFLHGISYYDRNIPRIIPDGIYGGETNAAVRAFQQAYGLTENGETNRATWEKIVAVYRNFVETLALALEVFPRGRGDIITSGDTGLAVLVIQAILLSLAQQYRNLPEVAVTGVYDPPTEGAVRQFQRLAGLPETGDTDIFTWNMLAAAGTDMTGRTFR